MIGKIGKVVSKKGVYHLFSSLPAHSNLIYKPLTYHAYAEMCVYVCVIFVLRKWFDHLHRFHQHSLCLS